MIRPTKVSHVMESYSASVDALNRQILKMMDDLKTADEPEKAFHLRKLIAKWFKNYGRL